MKGIVDMTGVKAKVNEFLMANVYSMPFVKKVAHMLNNKRDFYIKKYAHVAEKGDKKKMLKCLFKYGTSYEEYYFFDCRNNDMSGFITESNRWQYYKRLNGSNGLKLFKDKIKTYEFFKDLYGRECKKIDCRVDFDDFISRHPRFVYKEMDGCAGRGVKLVDASGDKDAVWQSLSELVPFVAEELIHQAESMAAFHHHSVNTIRLTTIRTGSTKENYKVNIFAPFAKFGQNGSFVDNGGSGGIFVGFDENGTIVTDGFDEMCHSYVSHPNSGIVFKGYQLPEFEKAVELATNAAMRVDDVRYIGWDLAYSVNGWVIVEGNSCAQPIRQGCDKIGRKRELDELMKQL